MSNFRLFGELFFPPYNKCSLLYFYSKHCLAVYVDMHQGDFGNIRATKVFGNRSLWWQPVVISTWLCKGVHESSSQQQVL